MDWAAPERSPSDKCNISNDHLGTRDFLRYYRNDIRIYAVNRRGICYGIYLWDVRNIRIQMNSHLTTSKFLLRA